MKRNCILLLAILLLFAGCKKNCPDCVECPEPECKTELEKGLLAYYPFNNNCNDESGNDNNGTAKNGAFLTSDYLGIPNSAAGFDGVNDYVIVPGSDKLNSDSFTVSFQVMVNNSNRRNVTVSRVNFETAQSIIFGIHESQPTDNKYLFSVTPGTDDCTKMYTSEPNGIYSNGHIQPGRWYNIIAIFGGGEQQLYVDGVLESTKEWPFNKAKSCANSDLVIGGWWKNDIVSIDGKIDEVYLYNRVLSDCEITELSKVFKKQTFDISNQ